MRMNGHEKKKQPTIYSGNQDQTSQVAFVFFDFFFVHNFFSNIEWLKTLQNAK